MRKPNDKCLLCGINKSEQRNSHILPRFLKRVIYQNNPKKHAILYKSDHTQIILQDIPKEDYILCYECEKKFAALETYAARELERIESFSRSFNNPTISLSGNKYKKLLNTRSDLFALFSYSLIWRMHISKHELFKQFELSDTIELKIRSMFNQYLEAEEIKLKSKDERLNNIEYPYLFVKPERKKEATWIIYYNRAPNNHIWFICALSYFIAFSDDETFIPPDLLPVINYRIDCPKIMILNKKQWQQVIDNMLMEFKRNNVG